MVEAGPSADAKALEVVFGACPCVSRSPHAWAFGLSQAEIQRDSTSCGEETTDPPSPKITI